MVAAEHVTDRHIAFMTRPAGGFLCLARDPGALRRARLDVDGGPTAAADDARFTVTIEAREGMTTGISAADQAHTMRAAADPSYVRDDLVAPPGSRPARASECRWALAGAWPAGAWREIMDEDSWTASLDALIAFADRHDLPVIVMSALADDRRRRVRLVERTTPDSREWPARCRVSGRDFVTVEPLHRGPKRRGCVRQPGLLGIRERDGAAVAAALDRDERSGALGHVLEIGPPPQRCLHARRRRDAHDLRPQAAGSSRLPVWTARIVRAFSIGCSGSASAAISSAVLAYWMATSPAAGAGS